MEVREERGYSFGFSQQERTKGHPSLVASFPWDSRIVFWRELFLGIPEPSHNLKNSDSQTKWDIDWLCRITATEVFVWVQIRGYLDLDLNFSVQKQKS